MFLLKNDASQELFYATTYSAGFDIFANESLTIPPSEWRIIKTGLRIVEASKTQWTEIDNQKVKCIPEMQIRPRSGLAAKFGITVLNSPSTIDADYRGEIMINLINHGKESFHVQTGDRIAQAICALVVQLPCVKVKEVERGTGGFGSTGK
jgi:dUTP pyrophosphatase